MRSDRGYMCFPEVDLGIPFLPGLTNVITKAIPDKSFYQMILTGKKYSAQDMLTLGGVDFTSESQASLSKESLAFAKTFNKKRTIFKDHKIKVNQSIIDNMLTKNNEAIAKNQFFLT